MREKDGNAKFKEEGKLDVFKILCDQNVCYPLSTVVLTQLANKINYVPNTDTNTDQFVAVLHF